MPSHDQLLPLRDDKDALYTYEVYDLDAERKVEARRERRVTITMCLEIVEGALKELEWLLRLAKEAMEAKSEDAERLSRLADALWRSYQLAHRKLVRYEAIPKDAPKACSCERLGARTLPDDLLQQSLDVRLLAHEAVEDLYGSAAEAGAT